MEYTENDHLQEHEILQRQSDLIRKWLAETTEPFYDWDWDGEELVVFVDEVGKEKDWDENNEPPEEWWELSDLATERYSYQDLKEVIEGFE